MKVNYLITCYLFSLSYFSISIGGRIIVFSSNQCAIGFGSVKSRDDAKLYNTPNEKALVHEETDVYVKLAEECVKQRVCVDLFFATNYPRSIDLATMVPIANNTGGDLHYFY